jgi:predicted N-acetyltransferase YhbS
VTAIAIDVAKINEGPVLSDRIEIRMAVAADNEALLALTRATPMGGTIALRIDREPDFFALLRARGDVVVYVATRQGSVIGCLSAAIHNSYVNGAIEKIAHVGDLKVHPPYRRGRVTSRLIATLRAHLQCEGVDICCSLVADGNKSMMKMVEGKHRIAKQVDMGRFYVEELIPIPFRRGSREFVVESAYEQDAPAIAAILERTNREKNFAPVFTIDEVKKYLEPDATSLFRKMLVARKAGQVVATLTIDDTRNLRQNVLVGLPSSLRFALSILRLLSLSIPGFTLPQVGAELSMLYVRLMGYTDGHEAALKQLISEARAEAYRRRYTFLSVGLHERDPMRFVVRRIMRFTFTSRSMATTATTPDRALSLVDRIPYEDFALV